MRIKTLVMLSVMVFLIGGLFGGGYGILAKQHVVAPVFQGLTQTSEEKMIDNFIADQEQKKADDSKSAATDQAEGKSAVNDNSATDADQKTDATKPQTETTDKTTTTKTDQDKTSTSGDESWIKLSKGEQVGTPTVKDGASLRLRKDASKNADTVGSVYNSDKLILDTKKNGWYHVKTKSGMEGWVSAEYIKVIK